jgi:multiple sugar transport system substrate-binding protein
MVPKVRLATAMALALVLTALTLVWGSGRSEAKSPVEIEFWHAMSRSRGELLESLVQRFNRANPDVVVKSRFVGSANPRLGNDYNALYGKILEHLARGTPPDISQVYENWTTQLVEINALTPMDQFLSGPDGMSQKDLNDFVPIFREANIFPTAQGNKLYTLPFNKSIYVLYYNRAIFRELGLAPPETWEDLRHAARTIKKAKGIPGLGFLPSVDIFGHYLYAHGGQFIQSDQAAFGGQRGIEDLKFWVDMVHTDGSAQPSTDAQDQFQKGQTGMYIETTSRIGGFQRAKALDFGVVMLPRGTTRAYQFAGTNLAIFSQSTPEEQKAAWRFSKFLTSPEITTEWAIGTGYLPVRESAIRGRKYQDYIRANPQYSVGIEALKYATVQPRVSAWESIRGILDDAMFEALSRKYTSEDAIQKAVSLSNDLLSYLQGKR